MIGGGRIAALEARAKADRRKEDARRKIVIGAGGLALAARNPDFGRWLPEAPDLLDRLRASGPGWQSRVNEMLRKAVGMG